MSHQSQHPASPAGEAVDVGNQAVPSTVQASNHHSHSLSIVSDVSESMVSDCGLLRLNTLIEPEFDEAKPQNSRTDGDDIETEECACKPSTATGAAYPAQAGDQDKESTDLVRELGIAAMIASSPGVCFKDQVSEEGVQPPAAFAPANIDPNTPEICGANGVAMETGDALTELPIAMATPVTASQISNEERLEPEQINLERHLELERQQAEHQQGKQPPAKRPYCSKVVAVAVFLTLMVALSISVFLVLQTRGSLETSENVVYDCQKPGLTHLTPGKYKGVSVNYLSFATNISTPRFPTRAREFQACTGGKIEFAEAANIWEDPINDLGSKASRGTEIFDGYLMSSSHFPEVAHLGLLEHLNDRISKSNDNIQWQDILPKVRSMGEFRKDGVTHVDFLMYDGDFFTPIVRLDLLEKYSIPLPNTWDELVEIAMLFNGTDLNDDGVSDYGFCHFPRRGAGHWDWWFGEAVYATWASVDQTEGAGQGFLFDETTFEPRIGAGFRFAAGIWKNLWRNGANCENTNFVEGRCAIGLGPPGCWKQVFQKGVKRVDANGALLWEPTMESGDYAEPYQFKPFGSTKVVDRSTGELVPCTKKLCPKAELIPKQGHHGDNDRARVLPESPIQGQLINRAPFFWSGGLGTAIRKSSEVVKKDLLWDFFTYTNAPTTSVYDLVDYPSWLDAWRHSQLFPGNNYLGANWSKTAYGEHVDIMNWALSSESNGAFNLRLPGALEYTRDVVGSAMLSFIEDLNHTEDDLVAEVISGWNKVTEKRGKTDQLQIYRASFNLEPIPSSAQ